MRSKIVPLEQVVWTRIELDPIVLAHGTFDILHPGHVRHLQQAATWGKTLVVGVTADDWVAKGPGRPIIKQKGRMDMVAALECVDYVILDEGHGPEMARQLKPAIVTKGTIDERTEGVWSTVVSEWGGELRLTEVWDYSSSRVSAKALHTYEEDVEVWLDQFRRRHTLDEVAVALGVIKDLRVLLCGSQQNGKIIYCDVVPRMEGEAPTMLREGMEVKAGGAVDIIDATMKQFCHEVVWHDVMFDQSYTVYVHTETKQTMLSSHRIAEDAGPQWDRIPDMGDFDLVVLADYGHGAPHLETIRTAEKDARFMAATLKRYPFTPNPKFGRYDRIDYLMCNRAEAEAYAVHRQPAVAWLMETCGAEGNTLRGNGQKAYTPALAVDIVDTVGCGDAMFSYTAPMLAKGIDHEIVSFIGACAAAMQTEIPRSSAPIDYEALKRFVRRLLA